MGSRQGPHDDALDRFERVLDQQLTAVNDIDQKTEHITRFVTLVLGIVISAASIVTQVDSVSFEADTATIVAFGVATGGFVIAVAGAIVTYQSSRIKVGLHHDSARAVANHAPAKPKYNELVLRAYADAIEKNRAVLDKNATRLRYTLGMLFISVGYLSLTGILYIISVSSVAKWLTFSASTVGIGAVGVAILRGSLLTLDSNV
jgi:hypothetical protein